MTWTDPGCPRCERRWAPVLLSPHPSCRDRGQLDRQPFPFWVDGHRGLGRKWAPGASVLPTLLIAPSLAGLSPDWQRRGHRPLLDLEVGSRAPDLCLFWPWGGEEGGREGEGGSQGPFLWSLASSPSADLWSQPAAAPPGAQRPPCTWVPPVCVSYGWWWWWWWCRLLSLYIHCSGPALQCPCHQ